MFDTCLSLPSSFSDVELMWEKHINPGTMEPDAFTSEDIKDGRSYYFYGTMVFHLTCDSKGRYIFKLSGKVYRLLSFAVGKITDMSMHTLKDLSSDQIEEVYIILKDYNVFCFRNLITERFGCCNDHVSCSDAGKCLHSDDRFYNGCQYRENLEAGRIFYGKNRNV